MNFKEYYDEDISDEETSHDDDKDETSDDDIENEINTKLSKEEIMMLVVSFFVRHNITKIALVDLLKIINLILDAKILPESHYKFTQYCHKILNYTKNYYCSNCKLFLGSLNIVDKRTLKCSNCSMTDKKYFISNSLSEYLKDIVSNNIEAIKNYSQQLNKSVLGDIMQGSFIEEMKEKFQNFFSISFNTDGIATFKSNVKKSVWPILVTINELPPKLRYLKKNIINAGLWLDNEPPPLEMFMKPFCDELKHLFHNGIEINSQNFICICTTGCLDSVARCKLLNFKQFNGKFGCTYCKHPGVLVKVGHSKQLRYVSDIVGEIRDPKITFKEMKEAETTRKTVFGVKGISILVAIPSFNVIFGCPVDVMHGVFLGVAKTLSELWLDSRNHSKAFYIGNKSAVLDDILENFHPYSETPRYPRQITQRSQWKANEWLNWMCYYSSPSLINILPKRFFDHFQLIVSAITRLLRNDISNATLEECEDDLKAFVSHYQMLYGKKRMVYNVHLLLHIVDCVRFFGPLWTFSLFPYESMNGFLKSCIKGPKEPLLQINNKYVIYNKVHNRQFLTGCKENVKHLCETILSSGSRCNKYKNSKKFLKYKFNSSKLLKYIAV